ncbi:hypothetical protein C900_05010 [Fulvivirga imtechensis AK7]|uniref:Uncharacterized protein n=1 Tax=Fulvivirga imtechensis AK7 TaxID=1237149 RepID=L8JML5_9BACT|nr:pinensin family lanthipeptide [Fulvivirga imtechensis]ELR69478.1 hypothetical protein C900_05010 [Fulvivirga imtechensis AK7]
MKNKKMKLDELKVNSFVTGDLDKKAETLKGGVLIQYTVLCNDGNTRKCTAPSNCACPSADFPCDTGTIFDFTIDWGQ